MEWTFQGENRSKVDGKGRVAIPAKFRRPLQAGDSRSTSGESPRLYIAYGNHLTEFVECFSGDYFDDLVAKIEAMPDGEDDRELLEYLYFAKCDEVSVDEAGRFVLPLAAREKLNLDGEALFQGMGRKFNILKPSDGDAADARAAALLEKFRGDRDRFNPISLANRRNSEPAPADGA